MGKNELRRRTNHRPVALAHLPPHLSLLFPQLEEAHIAYLPGSWLACHKKHIYDLIRETQVCSSPEPSSDKLGSFRRRDLFGSMRNWADGPLSKISISSLCIHFEFL